MGGLAGRWEASLRNGMPRTCTFGILANGGQRNLYAFESNANCHSMWGYSHLSLGYFGGIHVMVIAGLSISSVIQLWDRENHFTCLMPTSKSGPGSQTKASLVFSVHSLVHCAYKQLQYHICIIQNIQNVCCPQCNHLWSNWSRRILRRAQCP